MVIISFNTPCHRLTTTIELWKMLWGLQSDTDESECLCELDHPTSNLHRLVALKADDLKTSEFFAATD